MTVIVATKSGIWADSFCSRNTQAPGFSAPKIFKSGNVLVGCAGNNAACQQFLQELGTEKHFWQIQSTDADFEALLVSKGKLYLYLGTALPQELTAEFFAVGTGAAYALGAMEKENDPLGAVEVACKYDPNCKGPVHAVS